MWEETSHNFYAQLFVYTYCNLSTIASHSQTLLVRRYVAAYDGILLLDAISLTDIYIARPLYIRMWLLAFCILHHVIKKESDACMSLTA